MTFKAVFGLVCAIFLTPIVQADTLQALDEIEQAVYLHAMNDALANYDTPQVIVEPMDKRLRLQNCSAPFETFANSASNALGARTIGVRCNAPEVWTVYVPVLVKVMKPVVVSARPLAANQTLRAQDVKLQMRNIADLRQGYLQTKDLVVGQQLKYSLAMGMVIPAHGLKKERIVHRGEQVILVASAGTMEVRVKGTAMDDASLGESVKVKNNTSKRVVEGVVHRAGVVKVTM